MILWHPNYQGFVSVIAMYFLWHPLAWHVRIHYGWIEGFNVLWEYFQQSLLMWQLNGEREYSVICQTFWFIYWVVLFATNVMNFHLTSVILHLQTLSEDNTYKCIHIGLMVLFIIYQRESYYNIILQHHNI